MVTEVPVVWEGVLATIMGFFFLRVGNRILLGSGKGGCRKLGSCGSQVRGGLRGCDGSVLLSGCRVTSNRIGLIVEESSSAGADDGGHGNRKGAGKRKSLKKLNV